MKVPSTARTREQPIDQTVANRLVALLAPTLRHRLLDRCEHVEVSARPGQQLGRGRDAHSYFPTDCVISVLAPADAHPGLEVAAVGREGVFGPHAWIGAKRTDLRGIVSAPGHAWRIGHREFDALVDTQPELRQLMRNYVHVALAQTSRHAVCCRFHTLAQRLARWLLTHADCVPTDDVLVTHDRLAMLLGAQRAGVTVAAGRFERRGLIGTTRGHILVLDRDGLLLEACGCYGANLGTYARTIGVRTPRYSVQSSPLLAANALASARERTRSLR